MRVQLITVVRRLAVAACMAAIGVVPAGGDPLPEEPAVTSMFRYFSDSHHVGVRSLMGDYSLKVRGNAMLALHWNNERVRIPAIDAPVGSPEAVDAITTASRPISGNAFQDFVKVRNEFQGELSSRGRALEYYLSTESDYLAQQVAARYDRDFQEQILNLAVGSSYGWDAIEPLADSDTNTGPSGKTTVHWDVVGTRALTPTTLFRVGLEYNVVNGLQHNPYRNVYAGGTNVPERHPDERQRRDAFVKVNQYISNRSSIKLHYRLYDDDWGIVSNEIDTNLNQYITQGMIVRYDYRYYTQTSADFYRPEYATVDGIGGYRTADYRMGPLSSHLFGVSLDMDMAELGVTARVLNRMGVWVNYERYFNNNNYSANIVETALDFRF